MNCRTYKCKTWDYYRLTSEKKTILKNLQTLEVSKTKHYEVKIGYSDEKRKNTNIKLFSLVAKFR